MPLVLVHTYHNQESATCDSHRGATERLDDWRWICEASRFNHNMIKLVTATHLHAYANEGEVLSQPQKR